MEKVLFTRESQGEFTGIYAKIEGGRLTITRQDLGEFEKEYSKDGEVESYLFLDEANTKRLMNALQATSEEELLVILKKRFKNMAVASTVKSKTFAISTASSTKLKLIIEKRKELIIKRDGFPCKIGKPPL